MVRHEGKAKVDMDLLGGAADEVHTSLDAGLESPVTSIEKLLLVVVGFGQDVDGLLCTVGLGTSQYV